MHHSVCGVHICVSILLSGRPADSHAACLLQGQTHYNHLIGASLITFILLLVQRGVSRLCQGVRVANSLTYVPSALLLTFLTSAHPDITYGGFSFGGWAIALPVLLVVFAGL